MTLDPNPDPKVESIIYNKEGVSIVWGDEITDEEKEIVQSAFDDGEHNPAHLRALIEPY